MKKFRLIILNIIDKAKIWYLRREQTQKYKDVRRKKIYSKIVLTPEQKKEIDSLYINNYGRKIPYTWHRNYMAFTGNFDKNYFPELLYFPEFENFMNLDKSYCKTLSDKNLLPYIIQSSKIQVKMPKTIISCMAGMYKNQNNEPISQENAIELLQNIGECFAKPSIDTSSGRGCMLLNLVDGLDEKTNKTITEIISQLGNDFVIQECIKCHESISKIYSKSVNTFRVMTYRWKNEILTVPVIMRIGQGGNYLDNAHAGGMFIAVENDGTLHEKAFTEFKQEYSKHPNTNLVFKGYKIDLFPKVLETAKQMHTLIPQLGVINWDMTINEDGDPVLIEANLRDGSLWLFEIAWGKGPFGNKTSEILKWINLMEHTKVENRNKYRFGNMQDNNQSK